MRDRHRRGISLATAKAHSTHTSKNSASPPAAMSRRKPTVAGCWTRETTNDLFASLARRGGSLHPLQPALHGDGDGGDAVVDFEFIEEVREVNFHRHFRDAEGVGDELVRQAFDDEAEDFELLPRRRFAEVSERAGFDPAMHVLLGFIDREHDDVRVGRFGAQRGEHFHAGHVGEAAIEDDDIRPMLAELRERLGGDRSCALMRRAG